MKLLSLAGSHRRFVFSYIFLTGMFVCLILFGVSALHTEQQASAAARELSQAVLRFHVRADADTEEAQALKLQVRDEILSYVQPLLANVQNRAEAERILSGRLAEIEAVAEAVTGQYGQGEPVHAELTEELFPVRTYGAVTFPSGIYHSLTVTIGSGQGHNWWCVMYPTLCFQDSGSADISAESEEALTNLLSAEAQEALVDSDCDTSAKKADPVPRIRFRIFTFFNRFLPQ